MTFFFYIWRWWGNIQKPFQNPIKEKINQINSHSICWPNKVKPTTTTNINTVVQLVKIIEIMSPCDNITIWNTNSCVVMSKLTTIVRGVYYVIIWRQFLNFDQTIQTRNKYIITFGNRVMHLFRNMCIVYVYNEMMLMLHLANETDFYSILNDKIFFFVLLRKEINFTCA